MRDDGSGHPFYFPSQAYTLLGHWHPARGPERSLAVVLCATIGREELSAYPTLRALADRLAAMGFHTLRFDYPGCGDSGGDEDDPALVDGWVDAIDAAVDEVRRLSRADRVVLIGLRVGALLAAQAAARRPDVVGLAALAPILSGRRYVRELRLMAAAGTPGPAGAGDAAAAARDLDAGGYWLSEETCKALAGLDLLRSPLTPAPQVLIVERDDLPVAGPWAAVLGSARCAVETRAVPGIGQMMLDAHQSRVPGALLDVVSTWLVGVDEEGARDDVSGLPLALTDGNRPGLDALSTSARFGDCIETIEQIDCMGVRLEAVISRPAIRPRKSGQGLPPLPGKAVLIPNAGATRRSGPGRLQTLLAREVAMRGCVVMRVDLSGFGDSAPLDHSTGHPVYFAEAEAELEALCGWLREQTGARTCVVLGLCSGAYYGLRAATSPGTINELIAVNPLTFYWHDGDEMLIPDHTVQGEVRRYLQPKGQMGRLRKLLRGQVNVRHSLRLLRRHARSGLQYAGRDIGRLLGWPLRDDLARDLGGMLKRGVRVRFLIADSDPGVDMLRRQGGARVRRWLRRGLIRLEILENADHTFTRRESKQRLIAAVTRALQGRPSEPPGGQSERRHAAHDPAPVRGSGVRSPLPSPPRRSR